MIDFMVQYINCKTDLYSLLTDNQEIKNATEEIGQTLAIIFNNDESHIIMTLLRIELKLEYRHILDPIFRYIRFILILYMYIRFKLFYIILENILQIDSLIKPAMILLYIYVWFFVLNAGK